MMGDASTASWSRLSQDRLKIVSWCEAHRQQAGPGYCDGGGRGVCQARNRFWPAPARISYVTCCQCFPKFPQTVKLCWLWLQPTSVWMAGGAEGWRTPRRDDARRVVPGAERAPLRLPRRQNVWACARVCVRACVSARARARAVERGMPGLSLCMVWIRPPRFRQPAIAARNGRDGRPQWLLWLPAMAVMAAPNGRNVALPAMAAMAAMWPAARNARNGRNVAGRPQWQQWLPATAGCIGPCRPRRSGTRWVVSFTTVSSDNFPIRLGKCAQPQWRPPRARRYACMRVHACACVCMHVHACACMCMCVHACARVYMRARARACARLTGMHSCV